MSGEGDVHAEIALHLPDECFSKRPFHLKKTGG